MMVLLFDLICVNLRTKAFDFRCAFVPLCDIKFLPQQNCQCLSMRRPNWASVLGDFIFIFEIYKKRLCL